MSVTAVGGQFGSTRVCVLVRIISGPLLRPLARSISNVPEPKVTLTLLNWSTQVGFHD